MWKELIGSQGSLQYKCNKEGFNVVCSHIQASKARIGIVGNNENKCDSCDSRIGLGTGGYPDNSSTCGNEVSFSENNGDRHIKAMGYILLQYILLLFCKKSKKSNRQYTVFPVSSATLRIGTHVRV